MPTCWHCKAETTEEHYERVVYNHTALHGPWDGWRMADRELVAPDGQRITTERLRGLMVRQAMVRQALEAGLAAMQRAAKDPDPFGWQQAAAHQREQQRHIDRTQSAKNALGPDERCINGQRFRSVANGYVQINRPC